MIPIKFTAEELEEIKRGERCPKCGISSTNNAKFIMNSFKGYEDSYKRGLEQGRLDLKKDIKDWINGGAGHSLENKSHEYIEAYTDCLDNLADFLSINLDEKWRKDVSTFERS